MDLQVLLGVESDGVGLHAVTVAGYSMLTVPSRPGEIRGFRFVPLSGRRIDKLYEHDDQIGPFSRLTIHDETPFSKGTFPIRLETSWKDKAGKTRHVHPYAVIVPVYNKIRLRFIDVLEWLTRLDPVLSDMFSRRTEREWDVQLMFSNHYKAVVRSDPTRPPEAKRNILSAHHPRFWWRAVLSVNGQKVVELLFDATGIARSLPVTQIIWLQEDFATACAREVVKTEFRPTLIAMLS